MVTPRHEGLTGIATLDAGITAEALRALFDLSIPNGEARVLSCDLSEAVPAVYRADAAILYASRDTSLGVIVEVQLRPDHRKHDSWLAYIANLRARDHTPTCLVVICPNRQTATWASLPIETGHPGLTLVPLVIGPDNTSVITDVAEAVGNIGLAAIAAITHSENPQIRAILAALTEALNHIDPAAAQRYAEYVTVALTGTAKTEMEQLMATKSYLYQGKYAQSLIEEGRASGIAEGRASGIAEGRASGIAEGEAKSLLFVLEKRGVELSETDRKNVLSCTDQELLTAWLERALTARSVEDVFG
ncbi:hypothetical protein Aph01nite_56520 [Acrocarpospora phusangensis]|uniref:Uncharacterized protein n=1 Tax=Acrocarpospora phusangensis TaxID=1070424 RepID=A0A919QJI8_9ACTN|nr:hypothetical protein [Acrocarpospora phusangensis]GIH27342.1 hypothetical protein Aph01nite_56520 [Acrocarpospora phusangensis]